MKLAGPWGEMRVERDELGYPTIHAKDVAEATWARGYMHAIDRLVQVHLVLAAARGELMSMFGDKRFARTVDRAVRALSLTSGSRRLCREAASRHPKVDRDVLRRLQRGRRASRNAGAPPAARQAVELYTPESLFTVYRLVAFFGLTSMQQTAEMIVAELVARGAPRQVFDALLGDAAGGIELEKLHELNVHDDYALLAGSPVGGSNAFAVAGRVSKSGNALLMGEFHMEVGRFPPIVYASHVAYADGTFYQGLGIPGFVWNSSGRNDSCAFSCTFGHGDNVDLIAERSRTRSISWATNGGRSYGAPSAFAFAAVATPRSGCSTTTTTARSSVMRRRKASIRASDGAVTATSPATPTPRSTASP